MYSSSFDVVGTAGATLLAALGLAMTSGCQGFTDLQDLELARGEATYAATEVGATFAVALSEAQRFTQASIDAQVAWNLGSPVTQEGCATVDVHDGVGAEGIGRVRYDMSPCPSASGSVVVDQEFIFTPPEGTGGGEGFPGDPPDLPPGTEADYTIGDSLADADSAVQVLYAGYDKGLLRAAGTLSMSERQGAGLLAAQVTVGALDYEGTLDVDGDWSHVTEGLAARMSFAGTFESATGVGWTIVADNVVFQDGCMDSLGGELLMVFDNPAGRVTVETVFDDICDGCADLYVDGVQMGESCFGDGTTIGGAGQAGAQ